ncbi:MAG: PH domain-containing protein [Thermoanaerobaculales bacterium]|jgi:membrane protein YdbS with pleckstrin-like domain|nr:PH domain-containing protein [Thermoanaerobaculales bacterium]
MSDGLLSGLISRFLRVPSEPDPPLGSPGSVRVFRAAPGYLNYRRATWLLRQLGAGIGLLLGLAFMSAGIDFGGVRFGGYAWMVIEAFAVIAFLAQLPLTYLLIRLDYRYRWYMTTDTSLRIREGITTVRERTMTYANIQNLSLKQGPIQRLFGISDLQVRTAGGGGGEASEEGTKGPSEADNMHLGYFRGVDNAEEIRDLILHRMRHLKDSGLGDPDEPVAAAVSHAAPDAGELVAAASELRDEARALRTAMGV